MVHLTDEMRRALDALPTKSARIRALDARGLPRAEIARVLELRYQHVRNVLEHDRAKSSKLGAPDDLHGGPHGSSAPEEAALRPRSARLRVDRDGRVAIPRGWLADMDLDPEGKVTARVVDGELHLISPRVALRKLRAMARRLAPEGAAVVDEFIAEKRREAEHE